MSRGKTVEAHWATRSVYEVTLHPDGGSLPSTYLGTKDGNEYYRIKVYAGNAVEELPTPTKAAGSTAYEFLGWYTEASGGEKKDYTFEPAGNCDLYAHWAAKDVTVTFDAGEGALYLPSDEATVVYSGGSVKYLPGANCSGYIFKGWCSDLSDPENTMLTLSTQITENVTYHAYWSSSEDNYTSAGDNLYKYTIKWDTPSNEYATSIGDDLIIAPSNGNAALSATVYIRFAFDKVVATSNDAELPAGSVKIKVPKYIFETKDGQKVGSRYRSICLLHRSGNDPVVPLRYRHRGKRAENDREPSAVLSGFHRLVRVLSLSAADTEKPEKTA